MLHIIGLGLGNQNDITVHGLDTVMKCDVVYLENYTSKLNCSVEDLETFYGKKIVLANRDDVEGEPNKILEEAKTKKVGLLIIGDPMSATTHIDMLLRAKEEKVEVEIIHNVSIMTAIGIVGLQLYKYGKTTSITFPEEGFKPETCYDVLKMNQAMGLHSLFLLDLRPLEEKYMTVKDGLQYLLDIEEKRKEKIISLDTFAIGCARIGSDNIVKCGKISELLEKDFGKEPHCIIIPGKMHFMEEEALKLW